MNPNDPNDPNNQGAAPSDQTGGMTQDTPGQAVPPVEEPAQPSFEQPATEPTGETPQPEQPGSEEPVSTSDEPVPDPETPVIPAQDAETPDAGQPVQDNTQG